MTETSPPEPAETGVGTNRPSPTVDGQSSPRCVGAVIMTEHLERVTDFYAYVFAGERADRHRPAGASRTATLELGEATTLLTIIERPGAHRCHPVVVEVADDAALARVHRRLVCFVATDSPIRRDGRGSWVGFRDPDGSAVATVPDTARAT